MLKKINKFYGNDKDYYFLWSPEENGNKIVGPGAEIHILKPTIEYLYPHGYPGDGWDKLCNPVKRFNRADKYIGQGVDELGTAPMFNIYYNPPFFRFLAAHKDYRFFVVELIAYVFSDCYIKYGTFPVVDIDISESALKFAKRWIDIDLSYIPTNYKLNNNKIEDYDNHIIERKKTEVLSVDPLEQSVISYSFRKMMQNKRLKKILEKQYVQTVLF